MPRAAAEKSKPVPPAAPAAKAPPVAPLSGPQRAMRKLGLVRDIDLALHLPIRYEDETAIVALADAVEGEVVQVEGVVRASRVEQRARRQLLVWLDDGTGEVVLRFLNFYPSQQKTLSVGARLRVRGELRGGFLGREMVHPTCRVVAEGAALPGALTPVYPASAQLPQAYLRKAIVSALQRAPLEETLPPGCIPPGLPTLRDSLRFLHQPPPDAGLATLEDRSHPAWERLKFDELLAQQISQLRARSERAQLRAPALVGRPGGLHERLLAALPFRLTIAQRRVADEIAHDLQRAQPMHRLLQGDVGSGKTVVAALAALIAIDAGWQCALMAPTEILADQHFRKLVGWLEPLGVTVAWLTGSQKGKARTQMRERVASGEAQLVVGTHAVIQQGVDFARLGLAVIDEQHRFGVAQRLALRAKTGTRAQLGSEPESSALEPHLLMMSATPIPRTLAMTYFADLDVSTIDALPPGRTPIVTKLFAEGRREAVIERIRDEISQGRQVYWVCPLVVESEALDLRNATETHAELAQALTQALAPSGTTVGLLHGRMSAAEKAAAMALFTSGRMAVLVSTTVIEVGVDVPNASLMVIEHAERFGLAQLHQLRGRVGRGTVASVCVLLYSPPLSITAKERLKAMAETHDGFEIARRDLEIRGPGEFMGSRQSGAQLLRFADLAGDAPLVQQAAALAQRLLRDDPRAAEAQVQRWLASQADYLLA